MVKYYFTYGSDEEFPYQSGWTEVVAEDLSMAIAAFKMFHPNRDGSNFINCDAYYEASVFEDSRVVAAVKNRGYGCWDRITAKSSIVRKDEVGNEITQVIEFRREIVTD